MNDGNFETNKQTFDFNIDKFKRKGKKNYDFITRAGKHFKTVCSKCAIECWS